MQDEPQGPEEEPAEEPETETQERSPEEGEEQKDGLRIPNGNVEKAKGSDAAQVHKSE